MRLDHLLSREPIFWGDERARACVVGASIVFLCLHVFTAPAVGWWVWVRFWVGHKAFVASRHTVGFTFNTV